MSRFVRHENPPYFQNYQDYRPFLRRDFRFFCAYCERNEFVLGGSEFFEIDHFRPVHLFPEHTSRYTNLYYVCGKCADSEGCRSGFRTDVDHDSEVMPISVPN